MIRVGSPLCAHISSSDRVGSDVFESARTAYHRFGHSDRVGSSIFESARMIFCSELLKHAMIESARQSVDSRMILMITIH